MSRRQVYSRGDSFKYFAANRDKLLTCRTRREGDEIVCGTCGLRYGVDEPPPPCNRR